METRERLKRNSKKMQPTLHITALSQIALCNIIIPTDVHHVHDGVIHLMRIGRCNGYHNAGVYTTPITNVCTICYMMIHTLSLAGHCFICWPEH